MINQIIEEKAYAKLNLSLEILGKRDDGYHDILSLMAAVEMHDLLKLRHFKERNDENLNIEIISSGPQKNVIDSTPVEKNLIYRAACCYLSGIGVGADIVVEIDKNIPAGAGLGGGSADAAAMFRVLNKVYEKYSFRQLESVAASIGADIPFCIRNGFSICEGIGEIIEHLEGSLPYYVLLVNNGVHSNTAESYRIIDAETQGKLIKNSKKNDFRKVINEGMLDGRSISFINDFENAVFSRFPSVKDVKTEIISSGAFFVSMTGSGSTVFGLYENRKAAENALLRFSAKHETVCLTGFLNRKT